MFWHKHAVVVTLTFSIFKPAFKQVNQLRRYSFWEQQPWRNTCTKTSSGSMPCSRALCWYPFNREGLTCLIQYMRPEFPSRDSNWQPSSPLCYRCQTVIWKFACFSCAGFQINSIWCYHMLGKVKLFLNPFGEALFLVIWYAHTKPS